MSRPSWEHYAMGLASMAATRSEDPYCRVGAVVLRADNSVAGVGYNGAPSGIEIDWSDRDRRRQCVIHAEVNALRWVTPREVIGGWMASTHHPCASCLAVIASYGLENVVYCDMPDPKNYDEGELARIRVTLGIKITRVRYSSGDSDA